MTHPGAQAFLALWNSISSKQLLPEYDAWHTLEHVPERVGLPGFIEARRYRSHDADGPPGQAPRYFTCYWLASTAALASAQYREVFTHPTPWSARMRTELRDFVRLPCTLSGSCGQSTATQLATVHLRSDSARFSAQAASVLEGLVNRGHIVCAQWGTVEASDGFPIANRADAAAATSPGTDFVVMLQGLERGALQARTHELLQTLAHVAAPVSVPAFFELQSQVRQDELASPLSTRQPARPHLFQSFKTPGDKP
ncbi:MAG: hypothetical protein M3Q12_05715 [Pseudomonadota bacterium]|uniref:DUF4286 family protein n=1 Tax=Polaromonas sp. TaxID=1869339 RepID=UPI00183E45F0|nr:DUF4286 family protein [Polaromonas sp.]MBA3592651.1 hypothetical protein [Polaromonas sp.]MDQ3271653.1 hypothetical protein [Pseudomonadota bacterium]